MKMHSIFECTPGHNEECFCRLDSGLYRVYWFDSDHRNFMSNGALVHNVTHWIPVYEVIRSLEMENV